MTGAAGGRLSGGKLQDVALIQVRQAPLMIIIVYGIVDTSAFSPPHWLFLE
jgi:hypothetical protein